jgi:hypothetical protein
VLEAAIADGGVNPRMMRKDAVALRKPPVEVATEQVAPTDETEEQRLFGDLVLEQFFAEADGGDILARIPTGRRADVIRDFLDALGVSGMCAVMSAEFGAALRERVPKPKPGKPFRKTLNLAAAHMSTATSFRH